MGHPVDDFERGNDGPCWPPGETPKYIYATFWNTPYDGTYELTQAGDHSWFYTAPDPTFHMGFEIIVGFRSALNAWDSVGKWFDSVEAVCAFEHQSRIGPAWCDLWWGVHEGVGDMVGSGYLWSLDGTKYESLYWGNQKWTFKLCNTKVPSNILVRYEP